MVSNKVILAFQLLKKKAAKQTNDLQVLESPITPGNEVRLRFRYIATLTTRASTFERLSLLLTLPRVGDNPLKYRL
jgi:hypothetical protein